MSSRTLPDLRASVTALVVSTLLAAAAPALARQEPVSNQTFDADVPLQPGQCVSHPKGPCDIHEPSPVPGWVAHGRNIGVTLPLDGAYDEPWTHGEVGFVGVTANGPGWLQQDIVPTRHKGLYTLQLRIACRNDKPCAGYRIEVLFDGVITNTFELAPHQMSPGYWYAEEFRFETQPDGQLTIRLGAYGGSADAEVDFDNCYLRWLNGG
jgi:hypothetical protein